MSDIDLVVSFDTTGSMYPALAEVRQRVEEFVNQFFAAFPNARIGLIAHGDYNDRPYSLEYLNLVDNSGRDKLIKFVRTVSPTNGFGNGGEQYENVLRTLNKHFSWQAHKKIAIVIGDEPAHEFGKLVRCGSYSDTHRVDIDWRSELKELWNSGITAYPIRCLNRNDSRQYHNDFARIANVPLLELHQFNNIMELIYAITYKSDNEQRLVAYGEELSSAGRLNTNLAKIIDQLLNQQQFSSRSIYHEVNGLQEVDPTRFQVLSVYLECDIKSFVEATGVIFKKGRGFYELTKREEIQEFKEVILQDKITGVFYSGKAARDMIGLPLGQRGKLSPIPGFKYHIFVQSTSSNRKLVKNSRFLYDTKDTY